MPAANNRKRQELFRRLGFALTNFCTTRKQNITPKNFLQNAKQGFPCQSLESFSGEYYNMKNKILNFQFGPVCANQTCSVESEQDEAEIQHDRWSTTEWCNCEKCGNDSFLVLHSYFVFIAI